MVQFKAISKLDTSAAVLERFERSSGELKREVMRGLAEAVVANSPVDTGNYMLSHEVVSGGRSGTFSENPTTSHGLPRQQPHAAKAGQALATLLSQIDGFGDADTQFMLRNSAAYAPRVEYGGWGEGSLTRAVGVTRGERAYQQAKATQPYHVYARARAQAPQIIAAARARLGFT